MDHLENYFLNYNKTLEEKFDICLHNIESQLDKLFQLKTGFAYGPSQQQQQPIHSSVSGQNFKGPHPLSIATYSVFKSPYIRDFRGFSGPANEDLRQIKELTGTENIENLIRQKSWTKESKRQLENAVLDFYARAHLISLIKQKNILVKQKQDTTTQNLSDIEQKLNLIEEQSEQVKARKEPRIFVPEIRHDPNVDWCSVSAKLVDTHHEPRDCRLIWSNEIHWSVNNSLWTKEEDECLINSVQKHGKNNWDAVAKELNSNRLPWQCCSRYQQEFANSFSGSTPLTEDDKEKIVEVINLCRIGNFVPWNQVMYFIKYHNLLQVKYQWNKLLSDKPSNQPWSPQEDSMLVQLIEKLGDKDWNRIANYFPNRSNKSCRERYTMRLKYGKRAIGKWRKPEDIKLMSLVNQYGTNWTLISSHFAQRNSQQLRNRYELLKNEVDNRKACPIKHKLLYRSSEGFLVSIKNRHDKPTSDRMVDERLKEIFSSYQSVKPAIKSLVCRSGQDEFIHQNLVNIIGNMMTGTRPKPTLLSIIIDRAFIERAVIQDGIFTPCVSTIKGFKAWSVQQSYLNQFADTAIDIDAIISTAEYTKLKKIVISLFLWPALLARIKAPEPDINTFLQPSIMEKDRQKFYRIREIQKNISSCSQ